MKILVIGNCQAQVVAIALDRYLADSDVVYVFCAEWPPIQQGVLNGTMDADVLVYQDVECCRAVERGFRGRRIAIPLLELNCLWPFSNEAHPLNLSAMTPFCLPGPYGRQLSDAYLNRLMREDPHADPRTIADRYIAADYATMIPLDEIYAADRRSAIERGDRAGLDIWSIVEGALRHYPTFWTNLHPTGPLLQAVCRPIFEALDGHRSDMTEVARSVGDPLEFVQMPIHPSVIRHFGLQWCHAETKYRFFKEGRFTAWDYARRYCEFTYDAALAQTCHAYDAGTPAINVVEALGAAFLRHPESSDVAYYFSHALLAIGRSAEALQAARHASALEPERPVLAAHLVRAVDAFMATQIGDTHGVTGG